MPERRFGAHAIETAMRALLTQSPTAYVGALTGEGIATQLPDSFETAGRPSLGALNALHLVVPDDRKAVVDAWSAMLDHGSSRVEVHLAADPDHAVTVYHFDVRALHGVCISVIVPRAATPPELFRAPVIPLPPRLGRVHKDELSTIRSIDEGTSSMLGWTEAEMIGQRSLDFVHPDDHETAINNWMEMLGTPGTVYGARIRHRHKSGSWTWVQIINHNLLHADPSCVRADLIDISEEMAALEALRARERLLDRLAETLPVGLFQIDLDRRVHYCNDRLTQILGHDPRTVMAPLVNVIDRDRLLLDAAIETVLREGTDTDVEVCFYPTGTKAVRVGALTLRALTDDAGSVTGAIASLADVTDSASMRVELERRATYDELTGCLNRTSILIELNRAIARRETSAGVAVVFIDLDDFKTVNDQLGHQAGDEVLAGVASRLKAEIRSGDTIGRLGGDEFLVVCPHVSTADQALQIARRLAAASSGSFSVADQVIVQQLSVGVAWSAHDIDADALVAGADKAMYASKKAADGQPALGVTPCFSR